MDILDKWSRENGIAINKKKSGIMVIQNQTLNQDDIRGYPIKNWYKYLGVRIDSNLTPVIHLKMTNEKLSVYLQRNRWLLRDFFSPKSLVLIGDYFQNSRLSYGMCAFVDQTLTMSRLEATKMMLLRDILGYRHNVSNDRLRLALGLPHTEYILYPRLRKALRKYEEHFGERATVFDRHMDVFYKDMTKEGVSEQELKKMKDKPMKELARRRSVRKLGENEGIKVGDSFFEVTLKNVYQWEDRREKMVIRYMAKVGWIANRAGLTCELCKGVVYDRTHITDVCPYMEKARIVFRRELGLSDEVSVEAEVLRIFFDMAFSEATKKENAKKIGHVKTLISKVYFDRSDVKELLREQQNEA